MCIRDSLTLCSKPAYMESLRDVGVDLVGLTGELHRRRQIVCSAEVDAVVAAAAIDVEVMHDREQPGPQVAFALPQAPLLQRPL